MKSLYKILHTTCHTGWGGLEKRIFNESVWMEKNGHKIVIAAPKGTPLFNRAKAKGFKVYPVAFRMLTVRQDYTQLKRIIQNERPWVVNAHGDSLLAEFPSVVEAAQCAPRRTRGPLDSTDRNPLNRVQRPGADLLGLNDETRPEDPVVPSPLASILKPEVDEFSVALASLEAQKKAARTVRELVVQLTHIPIRRSLSHGRGIVFLGAGSNLPAF